MSEVTLKVLHLDDDVVKWIEDKFGAYEPGIFSHAVNRLLKMQRLQMEEKDDFDNMLNMLKLIAQNSSEARMILRDNYLKDSQAQTNLTTSVKTKIKEFLELA